MATKTKWVIDPSHSEISFKVRHLMITNIKGVFTEYNASIYTTGEDFMTAEADFWMNPNSLKTNDEKRDQHVGELREVAFTLHEVVLVAAVGVARAVGVVLEEEHHKEITFRTNTIEQKDDDSYELWGNLTIKGITKKIRLDVEFGGIEKDPWGGERAGIVISGKINRKDWDLNWNTALESGGVLVGDTVTINCEVELVKQEEAKVGQQ